MSINNYNKLFYLNKMKTFLYESDSKFYSEGKYHFKNFIYFYALEDKIKICAICYNEIQFKTGLDSCKHEFCYSCIYYWSLNKTTCPLCRAKFSKFLTYI